MKILLISLLFNQLLMAQEVSIMSYNIRYGTAADGENHWEKRKNKVADLMNYYAADFIGMQEAQKMQIAFLLQQMPQYDVIGKPRTNDENAEYSDIFYNKSRFDLFQQNTFWLSKTPDTISIGWDAALPRIATYGLFKFKDHKKFIWIINAHFDHLGATARLESAKMIVEKIAELRKAKDCEVVFMGDLNSKPDESPVQYLFQHLLEARTHCLTKPYGEKDTWNNFHFQEKPNGQIDYIFIADTGDLQIKKYITIDDFYDFKYPSDHLPVMATLWY
ncbi:MAG: endonuclease/exonuclease/phosphatase family protein [Chitinophagaceae bacterium]|nr:endonuclease/exonuclease/phosphatase family protein [Chitinophagaceae bacterium]